MRLAFAGTPEFAATILSDLIDHGLKPVGVYTQPDRPSGRGRRLVPSPVKAVAEAAGIPVRQPKSLKREALEPQDLDVLVVAAYGLLLPRHILEAPRYGCINVHASLLPRWRGAAPVERAIMAGDAVTGVSIMRMDEGLDTGPVYSRAELAIDPDTSGAELEMQLAVLGARALRECLSHLDDWVPEPQGEGACYAPKLTPKDSEIDWSRPAGELADQLRALRDRQPARVRAGDAVVQLLEAKPGAGEHAPGSAPGTIVEASKRAITVACGEGVLEVTLLKLNRGKGKPMNAAAALNGYRELFAAGVVLGAT